MNKIKITIADSHFLSRKGLVVALSENNDFKVIAEALSASDLINQAKFYKPDLIVIDYASAHFNLDDLKQIIIKYSGTKFLAITTPQHSSVISKALSIGVTSHLLKDCDKDEIIEAVYKTSIGEKFMCGKIVTDIINENANSTVNSSCEGLNISERELEIIKCVAEGMANKQIADKLFLSIHTVVTHRKNIMNKLGVNNTAGVVLFAVRENLVSPNHFLFSARN